MQMNGRDVMWCDWAPALAKWKLIWKGWIKKYGVVIKCFEKRMDFWEEINGWSLEDEIWICSSLVVVYNFFFLVNYDLCIYALRVVNMRRPMDCWCLLLTENFLYVSMFVGEMEYVYDFWILNTNKEFI